MSRETWKRDSIKLFGYYIRDIGEVCTHYCYFSSVKQEANFFSMISWDSSFSSAFKGFQLGQDLILEHDVFLKMKSLNKAQFRYYEKI